MQLSYSGWVSSVLSDPGIRVLRRPILFLFFFLIFCIYYSFNLIKWVFWIINIRIYMIMMQTEYMVDRVFIRGGQGGGFSTAVSIFLSIYILL